MEVFEHMMFIPHESNTDNDKSTLKPKQKNYGGSKYRGKTVIEDTFRYSKENKRNTISAQNMEEWVIQDNDIEERVHAQMILDSLPHIEKVIVKMYFVGFTFREIGEIIEMDYRKVHYYWKKFVDLVQKD